MKIDLIVEKNVIIKRDKPWTHFNFLNDNELLCYNENKKIETVNTSNGKVEHISNKLISTISKSCIAQCSSNDGKLCAFLTPNFEVTIWDKDKVVRNIPACILALSAIKTKPPDIFMSNNGEQIILILQKPCRIFLWLKSTKSQIISTRNRLCSPVCSSTSNRSTVEIGTWHELNLMDEHFQSINDEKYQASIDVFFRSKSSSITCGFVFLDDKNCFQVNRLDIVWKSTIYCEQLVSYSHENLQIPITVLPSSWYIRFAHESPILAIASKTNILLVSLTTLTFSKFIHIDCSFKTSPAHQDVFIRDLTWSYDDQFIIGLTTRGALFLVSRFGSQLQVATQGECISQSPSYFVIIHPLIGKDSEATTHLGLDAFMRSIATFSDDDKTKQQKFSLVSHPTSPVLYCSDGYRLARLSYSNKVRDKKFYDPMLSLYLMDLNKQQQQDSSICIHKTRSFDNVPQATDRMDTESIGGGAESGMLKRYGSLTSLMLDDLPELSLDDIFCAFHFILTSSGRTQHELCSSLARTTRTLLVSSKDILTSLLLGQLLTNLTLSSSFGSLTFVHLSCLAKLIPLFIDIFEQQTTIVNNPELLQLCILYIIEQWLQAILYLPTNLQTFELCRRQKAIEYRAGEIEEEAEEEEEEDNERVLRLCNAKLQLQLLHGTNVNIDEFLPLALPKRQRNPEVFQSRYNRISLVRSWYELWLIVEKKFHNNAKDVPKYLMTIRLFLQSVLHSHPALNAIRLLPYGHHIDLNDIFPSRIANVDHPLYNKSYSTLDERRKQRRRQRNPIDTPTPNRPMRRRKPPTEARKALVLHRILYALLEQYNVRDAICILNVALRRETAALSSCIPIDLFSSSLFQHIDTRTYFGMPDHALRSVFRSLARFMARSMMKFDSDEEYQQQLFIYSVDSAYPLPNLFKTKQTTINGHSKYRTIYIDRYRLNLAIQQQNISKFWQPLKVLELFVLGQSPNEAVLFSKLIGDWRTALCLASVLPPHNGLYDAPKPARRMSLSSSSSSSSSYTPLNSITVDALLYTKLCDYLEVGNLKSIVKHTYKQEEIISFLKNLPSTLEQFLLCATLLQVPLAEMLLKRLNATMIYLFTLSPIFISSKYYLPCPPIYATILNTYDDDKCDITCKYETHIRLIYYRTIHIFVQLLSASRIQLSCLKWYLDYLTMTSNKRKQVANDVNDSFYPIRSLLKSLRFHKLPNIPDRILIYFRDFCIILFLLDTRDRLSLTLRHYLRQKVELKITSDKHAWKIISYATILLSFRCLISDEMDLLRVVLNIFFDLAPSEQLMRALAMLIVARQHDDRTKEDNAELNLIINKLRAKWTRINPTYIQLYDGFLESTVLEDVQEDIIQHYMNDTTNQLQHDPLFDFKPKWFETCVEYGEFMTMLNSLLLDTSSLTNRKQTELNSDYTKYDSKSIPLIQTMSAQLRELELPVNLDKRYLLKQPPNFHPPNEYVVFPVHIVPNDASQTMFQQTPNNVNNSAIGSFVQRPSTQQPPGVVHLENRHRSNRNNSNNNNDSSNNDVYRGERPLTEWDGRSDDPSRSYVRQFDEPYAEAARLSIWLANWSDRDFTSTRTDQRDVTGVRIPMSAQFLAGSSLISDPQNYETMIKKHSQPTKLNNAQEENDSDLTSVSKRSEYDDGHQTGRESAASPRRNGTSRRNSLEESVSLPVLSNDDGQEFDHSPRFRSPSRETNRDETPTYFMSTASPDDHRLQNHVPPIHQRPHPPSRLSSPTKVDIQPTPQTPHSVRHSLSDRRFLEDSDPMLPTRLEKEEQEKYEMTNTYRTTTPKVSSRIQSPSVRDPHGRHPSPHDTRGSRSPRKDFHSNQTSPHDRSSVRSPTARSRHTHSTNSKHLPDQTSPSSAATYQPVTSTHHVPSVRLPLLHLRSFSTIPTFVSSTPQTRVPLAPPLVNVVPARLVYTQPSHQLQMLHVVQQPPPPPPPPQQQRPPFAPVFQPPMVRMDHQNAQPFQINLPSVVTGNRFRLQLLHLDRKVPKEDPTSLKIPPPQHNVVSTSTEKKIDKDIQVEVPRQDGFVIEPDLFRALLRDATGVNLTPAEAHYSAARQIQQQAIEARRRERSTMTDQPAYQILYDLQYARGGEGDERKFVNVADITGSHVDALLTQIERDQIEREQTRLRQQQEQKPITAPCTTVTNTNDAMTTVKTNGVEPQSTAALRSQPKSHISEPYLEEIGEHHSQLSHQPSDFYDIQDLKRKSDLILQRRRQREEEEKQAERRAFGNIDSDRSQKKVFYDIPFDADKPEIFENIVRKPFRLDQPYSDSSQLVDPISVRSKHSNVVDTVSARSNLIDPVSARSNVVDPVSARSNHLNLVDPTSARSSAPYSPHKQLSNERPISSRMTETHDKTSARSAMADEIPIEIKTTTSQEPFSPRKISSHSCYSTSIPPHKTTSPTIAERHREARLRKQHELSEQRARDVLEFVDHVLHDEPLPRRRTFDESNIEALETSFLSSVPDKTGVNGLINRTYDLDLTDDGYSNNNNNNNNNATGGTSSRPMSAIQYNYNHNLTQRSTASSIPRRSASASARSSRTTTSMGKAILQAKQKGPPPARSNMARKRPLSSPGNLGQRRGSMTMPTKRSQDQNKIIRTMRKTSPPSHKPTTYNERVRALNKTDSEIRTISKSNANDPKALMRLYGTRRVPGLYVPYEKAEPRITTTYSERMKELQPPGSTRSQTESKFSEPIYDEDDLDRRPSSAPTNSLTESDWEVDDRVKNLLADDQDMLSTGKDQMKPVSPLASFGELDENMDETTFSLTRVTERTYENTYGDDLPSFPYRRTATSNMNTFIGTKVSARSSLGGDITARDESELSRGETSYASVIDWSQIDRDYMTGTQ